ncbi:hypothetical protein GGF32_007393 [Allomyces javanicus]|nr:hypothetical protein GGF32_007393 [Allomyces javanicus]
MFGFNGMSSYMVHPGAELVMRHRKDSKKHAPSSPTPPIPPLPTDDEGLADDASSNDRKSLRVSTATQDSARPRSASMRASSSAAASAPTTPTSAHYSTFGSGTRRPSMRPPTASLQSPDDFLAEMLGELHSTLLEYENEDTEAGPVSATTPASAHESANDVATSAVPLSEEEARAAKAARNRARAVKEIVGTEATYVDMLAVLLESVVFPFREVAKNPPKKSAIAPDDPQKLFSNIEEIHAFHRSLLDGLQERYALWDETSTISDIFLTISPFLKMYKMYMANYPIALETLTRLRTGPSKQYGDFQKLLKVAHESPDFKGLDIQSFLILPIQRIPRYILLLEQLVHYTSDSHPDYDGLTKCIVELRKTADHINAELHKYESRKKVLDLQNQIIGRTTPLLAPARRFLHMGDVQTPMLMAHDDRTVMLFTDLILVTKRVKDGQYELKSEFDLANMYVKAEDQPGSSTYLFHLVATDGAKHTYALSCTTKKERNKWVHLIDTAINDLQACGLARSDDDDLGLADPIRASVFHSRMSVFHSGGRRGSATSTLHSIPPVPPSPTSSSVHSLPYYAQPASPNMDAVAHMPRRGSNASQSSHRPRSQSVGRQLSAAHAAAAAAAAHAHAVPMPPMPATPPVYGAYGDAPPPRTASSMALHRSRSADAMAQMMAAAMGRTGSPVRGGGNGRPFAPFAQYGVPPQLPPRGRSVTRYASADHNQVE